MELIVLVAIVLAVNSAQEGQYRLEPVLAVQRVHYCSAIVFVIKQSGWSWQQGLQLTGLYRHASWNMVYMSTLYDDQLNNSHFRNTSLLRSLYVLPDPSIEIIYKVLQSREAQSVLVYAPTEDIEPQDMLDGIDIPPALKFLWLAGDVLWQVYQTIASSSLKMVLIAQREKESWSFFRSGIGRWTGRLDLKGTTITTTSVQSYVRKDEQNSSALFPIDDYPSAVWKTLMKYLNFTTKFVRGSGNVGQKQVNGSWTGIIGMMESGEVDTCMTVMMPTVERAAVISILRLGLIIENRIFIKNPEFDHSWSSSMQIFSLELWLTFLGTAAVLAVMLWLISSVGHRIGLEVEQWNFSACCVQIVGFVSSQGLERTPSSHASRIVCLVCLVFSYCISQFYSSVLVSQLTTRISEVPFKDMEQFVERNTHSMIMFTQMAPTRYAQMATSGVMKELWDKFIKGQKESIVMNPLEAFPRMCEGRAAAFAPTVYMLGFWKEAPCEIIYLKPVYFKACSGITTRKNFRYLPQFNHLLQRMMETGVLHYLTTKYFDARLPETEPSPIEAISLNPVSPFFFLLGCGIITGSAILLVELYCHRYLTNRQTHNAFLP